MPRVTCPNGHRVKVSEADMGTFVTCDTCKAEFEAEAGKDDADDDGKEKSVKAKPFENGMLYGRSIAFWVCSVLGKPALLFGLVLVILGRGCDATGMRSVSRTDAQYRQAQILFDLEWDAKLATVSLKSTKKQKERDELSKDDTQREKNKDKIEAIGKELKTLGEEYQKLAEDKRSLRSENEVITWKPLREASLKASNGHRVWSYYYEIAFILGTVILVLGLLIVAFAGEGAERWVAYIMMAIITFSIYVGGAAWIESIVTSATSMQGGPPPIIDPLDPPRPKKGGGFQP